ncbi:MAG: hypothetical protein ACK5AV_00195 [Alphaproteobacteria bacterium]|nr:hypothetical protein [Candidatus Jidaibacter sp.]
MDGYSNDINLYMKQVNKIISEHYYKTVYLQKSIANAVNSDDFDQAIFLTLTSTQLSNLTKQNKILADVINYNRDAGMMLCGELIKSTIVNRAVALFSEESIQEALMNVNEEHFLDVPDGENIMPFEEYQVHRDIDDTDLLMGCIIEYTHADQDSTIIEMNFDKYALRDWLEEHVLVVDGGLQITLNL